MNNDNLLLCRPSPEHLESWRGYILRLSEANHAYDPRVILRLSEIDQKALRTNFPSIEDVSRISSKSVEVLDAIFPMQMGTKYRYLGHFVPKQYLRFNSPHICPECVVENGYISARWDIEYMNVCHIHRMKLISKCNSCNTKLPWYRPEMLMCKCGNPISHASEGNSISKAEIDFAACLAMLIEKSEDLINSPIPKAFNQMSLSTFLGLFNTFGTRSILNSGVKSTIATVGDEKVYLEGIRIITNWEYEFSKLMTESAEVSNDVFSTMRSRHNGFHGALFKKGYPAKEMGFIEESYKNCSLKLSSTTIVDRRLRSKFSIATEEIRYIGMCEAAHLAGVMQSTMRRKVKAGRVSSKMVTNHNGNEVCLIDRESITRKLNHDKGELGLRAAAAYVGLPVKVLKSLRSSDHIKQDYRTVYPDGWAILDLDIFIERIYEIGAKNRLADCSDPIELKYTVQRLQLGSEELKADIVRAILNEQLVLYSSQEKVASMFIGKKSLDVFLSRLRISNTNRMTLKEISDLTGLCMTCGKHLKGSNFFRSEFQGRQHHYYKEDVEQFHAEFIALSKVASEFKIGVQKLLAKIEKSQGNYVKFIRNSGIQQYFVKRTEVPMLIQLT